MGDRSTPYLKSVIHEQWRWDFAWEQKNLSTFVYNKTIYYDVIIFADVSIFVDDVIIWEYIGKSRHVK